MKTALFFKPIDNQRIQCTLCPRYCRLKPGQHGFCYVRKNKNGALKTIAYGKPYAVNVDPIEKKPLFHFLPGSRILSIGTAGCNMACKFCQNWDLSKAKFDQKKAIDLLPARVVQLALHYKAESIAYTYNEPTIFAEYLMEISAIGHRNSRKNVMVTNGYISQEAITEVYKNIDGVNIDLKAFSEEFYTKMTLSHLAPVLETLRILYNLGIWVEITNLIIPGLNDSPEEITRLCEWILFNLGEFVPIHFTAFHPDHKLTNIPPTLPRTLLATRKRAREIGLKYVYVGNVDHREASSTYCHNCDSLLIQRDWYHTKIISFQNGQCTTCQTEIPGVFN